MDEFRFVREDHHDKNGMRAPWIRQKISAHKGGDEVGYLKIAYVPENRVQNFFENPFLIGYYFGAKRECFNRNGPGINPKNGDGWLEHLENNFIAQAKIIEDELLGLGRNGEFGKIYCKGGCDIKNLENQKKAEEFVGIHKKKLVKIFTRKYQGKIDYHFMKPDVDYIFVDEKYRRMGVSQQLYEQANKWMGEIGMKLHSSTLQEIGARGSWEKLKSKGLAEVYHSSFNPHPRFKFK